MSVKVDHNKKSFLDILSLSPSIWIAIFLFVNIFYQVPDSTNGMARVSLYKSMLHERTFNIDKYILSEDWSQTPDGHFYSNKAPGPNFIGFPFYFIAAKNGASDQMTYHITAVCSQTIPLAIVAFFLLSYYRREKIAEWKQHIIMAGLLMGTTGATMMNTNFGHGHAVFWVVALWLCYYNRTLKGMAFCFGWLVLSDYAAATLLPFLLFLWFSPKVFEQSVKDKFYTICAGAAIPGLLWCIYHYACFGSIFSLPFEYLNPMFREVEGKRLWGVLSLPKISAIYELILGSRRGLIVTQPLVLFMFFLFLIKKKWFSDVKLAWVAILNFLVSLFIVSSHNHWDAGASSGPRYLATVLPIFILLIAHLKVPFKSWVAKSICILIAPSLLLWSFVYSSGMWHLIGEGSLWEYYPSRYTRILISDFEFRKLAFNLGLVLSSWALFWVIEYRRSVSKN